MSSIFDIFDNVNVPSLGGALPHMHAARDAKQSAMRASSQADRAMERSLEAEFEVERLRLVTQAMWEFLKDQTDVTDSDLEARIQEIDLRDGKNDGKLDRQIAVCGQCHRKTGVRAHRLCFYCGSKLDKQHIVER
jgi:ribosomal protein L32